MANAGEQDGVTEDHVFLAEGPEWQSIMSVFNQFYDHKDPKN